MKSIEIQAPDKLRPWSYDDLFQVSIFLAGSIGLPDSGGSAEPWQDAFVAKYPDDVLFLNPRRADWDSTWDHNSDQFNQQVNWELDMMDYADIIVMYFDPNTKSPITLLELGLHAKDRKLIVCCPDGFWRQGNVRVVCERYNIPYFTNKDEWFACIDTTKAKMLY